VTGRLKILDVWVDPVTMEQALDRIVGFVERGKRPHAVFAVNPEKNFSVPKDPLLHDIFRAADLLIPDGIGVVMAARILHGAKLSRVPGVELMEGICRLSARRGFGVFLFGAREETSGRAAEVLRRRYPGLRIVGRANGYVKAEEMPRLVETINASAAQVLFLALGSPRQEKWFAENRGALTTVRVCQGIGGTLDVIAGSVRRAPWIWRRMSAEWLYRLLSDPRRIGRQRVLPLFAAQVLCSRLGFPANGRNQKIRTEPGPR
jgi:N-acetylglucosaminyldiphosphoundecaprenol N-acetyl-beta-D-mannosaminyltransferase